MYPDELLDRFSEACGNLSDAALRMRVAAGSSDEGVAASELRVARMKYDAINRELDEIDA